MVPPTPGCSSHLSSCNQGNFSQTCWGTHLSASSKPSTMWECWIWNQQEIIFCKQVVIGLIKMRRATLNVCNIFWVRPISNKEVWVKGFPFCLLPIACQWGSCSADVTALCHHYYAPSLPCTITALSSHCPALSSLPFCLLLLQCTCEDQQLLGVLQAFHPRLGLLRSSVLWTKHLPIS